MMIWLSVPQIGVDRVGAARKHRSHAYPRHVSWRCKNIGGSPGNRLCSPFRSQVIDGNQGGTLLNLRRIGNMHIRYRTVETEMVFSHAVRRH